MTSLFRPEAIEGQRQSWLGGIQLIRPLSLSVLTGFVLVAAASTVGFLIVGEYTRNAHVSGVLVPDLGSIRLVPQQAGTVLESHVREGQAVNAGELLFVLSVDHATLSDDTQGAGQHRLNALKLNLRDGLRRQTLRLQSQIAGVERRIVDMRRELAELDAEVATHAQRLMLTEQAKARLESPQADDFVSTAAGRSNREELLDQKDQLQALMRQRASHVREIGALDAQLRELPLLLQALAEETDRRLASTAQESHESEARQRIVIRAPRDGVITAVRAEPGQTVSPAVALASLVPAEARLQAQLYAPSSAIGFLHAQQPVLLRYQAFPYQQFGHYGGRVLDVSRIPLPPNERTGLSLSTAATGAGAGPPSGEPNTGEPLYRITVALDQQEVHADGQAQPLSAGMQLDADVLLERRRLIEWLFEPMLGIAGRV